MRQLVDGHDTGMLELSGNLRFAQETSLRRAVVLLLRLQLLEGDVAAKAGIAREPDAAYASDGVELPERVPGLRPIKRRDGCCSLSVVRISASDC